MIFNRTDCHNNVNTTISIPTTTVNNLVLECNEPVELLTNSFL